jgi:hypothetical protein
MPTRRIKRVIPAWFPEGKNVTVAAAPARRRSNCEAAHNFGRSGADYVCHRRRPRRASQYSRYGASATNQKACDP